MIELLNNDTDGGKGGDRAFSVLVVDDEPDLLTSLQQLLEAHGYGTTVAVSAASALRRLSENRHDLLLLDLAMPGMSGTSVLDFVAERCLDMAIIVISGTTSVVEATSAMRRGAIDYLRKPFGPEELLASIANATRKLQLERSNRLMRDRVEASEHLHRFLVNNSPDLIFVLDVEGNLSYLNERVQKLLGFETKALLKQPLANLVVPADQGKLADLLHRLAMGTKEAQLAECRFFREKATPLDYYPSPEPFLFAEITAFPILSVNDSKPVVTGSYLVARDVTSRRWVEEALHQANARLEHVISASPAVIYSRDPQSNRPISFISSNVSDLLGYRTEELLANEQLWEHLVHPDDRARFNGNQRGGDGSLQTTCEYRLRHRDGNWRWIRDTVRLIYDDDGHLVELVGSWLDNTEAQRLSEQLNHQASHDSLTELANRRVFELHLQQALEIARAQNVEHALFYIDLDQFKIINDTCGHMAGDALLRQLSRILQAWVRKQDMLARLGGDEFGVLMQYCSLQDAMRVANSLCRAIGDFRFAWGDKTFHVGASIGVVSINAVSESADSVLSAADSACYAAKDAGRNRTHLYTENDTELSRRQGEMHWVARINQALEENRFQLAFQPIVPTLGQSEGHHYELLLRMEDEIGQLVPPGHFLPAAEHYHLAVKLDRWVVNTALDWLSDHPDHLQNLALCSINLSGLSLGDNRLLDYLLGRLTRQRNLTRKLCFEVTETAAIANFNNALHFISTLKGIGCRFALDDFGSGLSSFAYLKRLPVDFLKIDGIFVKDIANDPVSRAIVNSINQLGHVMGMKTIAEFVENDRILVQLRAIGVNYAQGYRVGKPRSLQELVSRLPSITQSNS